jgi:hypothetical protein
MGFSLAIRSARTAAPFLHRRVQAPTRALEAHKGGNYTKIATIFLRRVNV